MRFYDLCGIMPGRPAKLIVNLCEQPGCSLLSPLHLTHCLAEEEKEASRGIERVQRLRFRSQQLSLSSLNFNGKAKFFQLSFHTLPLSLSCSVSVCLPLPLVKAAARLGNHLFGGWKLLLRPQLLLLLLLLWLIPSTCSAGETKRFW